MKHQGQTKHTTILDSEWRHNVDLCSTDYLYFILVLFYFTIEKISLHITGNLLVATQLPNIFMIVSIYYSQKIQVFPVFWLIFILIYLKLVVKHRTQTGCIMCCGHFTQLSSSNTHQTSSRLYHFNTEKILMHVRLKERLHAGHLISPLSSLPLSVWVGAGWVVRRSKVKWFDPKVNWVVLPSLLQHFTRAHTHTARHINVIGYEKLKMCWK